MIRIGNMIFDTTDFTVDDYDALIRELCYERDELEVKNECLKKIKADIVKAESCAFSMVNRKTGEILRPEDIDLVFNK